MDTVQNKNSCLDDDLHRLRKENTRLKEREKSLQLELESGNKARVSLVDEMGQMKSQISHLRQENERLEDKIARVKNKNRVLKEQVQRNLEEEVNRLRNEVTVQKRRYQQRREEDMDLIKTIMGRTAGRKRKRDYVNREDYGYALTGGPSIERMDG
jgi:chromosome segregation ATPase